MQKKKAAARTASHFRSLFNVEHCECRFEDAVEHLGDFFNDVLEQILDVDLGLLGNDGLHLGFRGNTVTAAERAVAGLAAGAVKETGAVCAAERTLQTVFVLGAGTDFAQIKVRAVQAATAGAGRGRMRFAARRTG